MRVCSLACQCPTLALSITSVHVSKSCARLVFDPFSQGLRFHAALYAGMGAASSMYFMYLQLGFIRELCSYCMISAVTSILLFATALWQFCAARNPAI
jgi:uncharacterized membrane protein